MWHITIPNFKLSSTSQVSVNAYSYRTSLHTSGFTEMELSVRIDTARSPHYLYRSSSIEIYLSYQASIISDQTRLLNSRLQSTLCVCASASRAPTLYSIPQCERTIRHRLQSQCCVRTLEAHRSRIACEASNFSYTCKKVYLELLLSSRQSQMSAGCAAAFSS